VNKNVPVLCIDILISGSWAFEHMAFNFVHVDNDVAVVHIFTECKILYNKTDKERGYRLEENFLVHLSVESQSSGEILSS